MKYSVDQIGKHEFEVSGCGVAPFTFQFLWAMPHPSIMENIGGVEMYNTMMQSAPCRVGCCRHCGMPLIYHYIIKDANGDLFAVGCECVAKTGDEGLIKAVEKAKKQAATKKREDKKASKQAIIKAQRDAEIKAKIDAFTNSNPLIMAFLEAEVAKDNCLGIWVSFMAQLRTWGNLSVNQIACIEKAIEKSKEPVVESQFVGSIGERVTITGKVEKIITVPCSSFFYGDRNSIDIYIIKDNAGNVLIYRSKDSQLDKKSGNYVESGSIITVTATVKSHEVYKGINQTLVQRPKWTVM